MTVDQAKLRYGHVYEVVLDRAYTYRPLTVGEYRKLYLSSVDDALLEEAVCKLCLIDPADIDFDVLPGRIPTALYSYILESSLLDSDETMDLYVSTRVNLYRKSRGEDGKVRIGDSLGLIMLAVSQAFPSLDPLRLRDLTTEELLDLYAMALYKSGQFEKELEEKAPKVMPTGLSPQEQQAYKEHAAALYSQNELRKAMEDGKAKSLRKFSQ
jgi:hypothetical protein